MQTEKSLQRKISVETENSLEKILSGDRKSLEKISGEKILCREKSLERQTVQTDSADRQKECPVYGKEAVSLKNTGRFVQEHNCSLDEAISEPGI